jgi:hypothetical protein
MLKMLYFSGELRNLHLTSVYTRIDLPESHAGLAGTAPAKASLPAPRSPACGRGSVASAAASPASITRCQSRATESAAIQRAHAPSRPCARPSSVIGTASLRALRLCHGVILHLGRHDRLNRKMTYSAAYSLRPPSPDRLLCFAREWPIDASWTSMS